MQEIKKDKEEFESSIQSLKKELSSVQLQLEKETKKSTQLMGEKNKFLLTKESSELAMTQTKDKLLRKGMSTINDSVL